MRALAVGPQAEVANQLLAELAAARKVLLSAATRRVYDAELRQKLGMPPAAQPRVPAAQPPRMAPAAVPVASAPVAPAPVAAVPVAAVPMAAVPMNAVPLNAVPVAAQATVAYPAAQAAVPMAAIPMAAVPMAAQPMVAQAVPVAGGYMPTAVGAAVATPLMAAVPQAAVPQAAVVGVPNLALDDGPSEASYRPRFRRQSSGGSWVLLAVGFLVLGGLGAVCFAYKDRLLAALNDRPETTEVVTSHDTSKGAAPDRDVAMSDTQTQEDESSDRGGSGRRNATWCPAEPARHGEHRSLVAEPGQSRANARQESAGKKQNKPMQANKQILSRSR